MVFIAYLSILEFILLLLISAIINIPQFQFNINAAHILKIYILRNG